MCENCNVIREQCWAEIRDLLNFNRKVKGPLSEEIQRHIDEIRQEDENWTAEDEEHLPISVEAIRAHMIFLRCVRICHSSPGTVYHGERPSRIVASWAGELMQQELEQAGAGQIFTILNMLLGEDDENAE